MGAGSAPVARSRARCTTRATKAGPSPLAGKLFDEDGECLYVAGAAKGERRYRYYVSRHLVTGSADKVRNGWRLSAQKSSGPWR